VYTLKPEKRLTVLSLLVEGYSIRNFRRRPAKLRMTPAMAAGVTDRLWSLADLVG
jgi:hypothetical protein